MLLWLLSAPQPLPKDKCGGALLPVIIFCVQIVKHNDMIPLQKNKQKITLFPFNWAVCVEKKKKKKARTLSCFFWTLEFTASHFQIFLVCFSILSSDGGLQDNSSSLYPIPHLLVLLDAGRGDGSVKNQEKLVGISCIIQVLVCLELSGGIKSKKSLLKFHCRSAFSVYLIFNFVHFFIDVFTSFWLLLLFWAGLSSTQMF